VVIKVRENGPLKVTGPAIVTDASGTVLEPPDPSRPLVLCRCGRSRTKPWCDDSHARSDSTRTVHAGLPEPAQGEPLLPGPVFASAFRHAGEIEEGARFYGRYHHPTWEAFEAGLAALEGGPSLVFGSGMAAVSAVLLTALPPGSVLVAPSDGYFLVRRIAREHLAARGVEVRLVPTSDEAVLAALPGATLLWLETPSNPMLDTLDLERLCAAAREAGALVAVDNTLATPLRQRPLEAGADFSVAAATKQLCGHADLVLGYVSARDPERARSLRDWRTLTGSIAGPFETWLAHRSLPTLALRVERQEATAAAVARLLAARPEVSWSRWPGLGCVVSLDLGDRARAEAFLGALELVGEATSFGGVHATAERRERVGDEVSPGLVRLSVGVEDTRDVLADLERGLAAAVAAPAA
jgi:cystathionine gamma-lyase